MSKLSIFQRRALELAIEHGGLERWDGGFWTYPGCHKSGRTVSTTARGQTYPVPAWYVAVGTIHSLVKGGLLAVTEITNDNWWRKVAPTEQGRKAV